MNTQPVADMISPVIRFINSSVGLTLIVAAVAMFAFRMRHRGRE